MAKRGLEKYVAYPSIVLGSAAGVLTTGVAIPFAHLNYSFTIDISRALYEGAKTSGKSASVPAGIGDAWLAGYYRAFICDPAQDHFYPALLTPFRKIRRDMNLNSDRYLELLSAYVQSLPYDTAKTASINLAPRFPVETVADATGICSDKSLLLAGMMAVEGYKTAILHFSKENHLAVGISVPPGFDYQKTGYAVIETTAVSYIGTLPCGETTCTSRPKIIPIGNGTKTYSAIRDTAKIFAMVTELKEKLRPDGTLVSELIRLKKSIDDQTGELRAAENTEPAERCRQRLLRLQKTIHQYNSLAGEFERAQELAAFIHKNRMDRLAVSCRLSACE